MNTFPLFVALLLLLQSCASIGRKAPPAPTTPTFEKKMDARVEESHATDPLAESKPEEETREIEKTEAAPAPRAPLIGIWVEGAGLESFAALGFMQELHRAGVRFVKVVGTGWGCWVALSWANEASPNQAEWQAFKWSSWEPMGLERGFLSRIRGDRASFEDFARELKVWLPKNEFSELAMPADCPLLSQSSASMDLVSGQGLGVHKALWEQLQMPLYDKRVLDPNTPRPAYLSGIAAGEPRLDEYDRFAAAGKTPVELWIHLKASPAQVLAPGDRWLSAAFTRRELRGESWIKTKQGRWVMRMPLFMDQKIDAQKSLDFGGRRALLLKGRDSARAWMRSDWFQTNLAPTFANPQP